MENIDIKICQKEKKSLKEYPKNYRDSKKSNKKS